jgi:dipeptidyl aminopeptidase/acylaminoacyl peptidase
MWFVLGVACGIAHAVDSPLRPFTVDDLLSLEEAQPSSGLDLQPAFAPSGQALAFTTVRSRSSDPVNWAGSSPSAQHTDIWMQEKPGDRPKQITHGMQDGSGWFDPQWSPDGSQLLVKSTRGQEIHLYLWALKSGKLRSIESQPIDLAGRPGASQWVDDARVAFATLPGHEPWMLLPQTEKLAERAWAAASSGLTPTANVITSAGAGPHEDSLSPLPELVLLDTIAGTSRVLVRGDFGAFHVSPNRRWLEVSRSSGVAPPAANTPRAQESRAPAWFEVFDLGGNLLVDKSQTGDFSEFCCWSASGDQIAFWRYDGSQHQGRRLYRVSPLSRGAIPVVVAGDLEYGIDVSPFWTAAGDIVVKARKRPSNPAPGTDGRWDWYLLDAHGSEMNLTSSASASPSVLAQLSGGDHFVGLVEGEAWEFYSDGHAAAPVATVAGKQFKGMQHARAGIENWILTTESGGELWSIDGAKGNLSQLHLPLSDAVLAATSNASGDSFYYAVTRNGTFLWRMSRDGRAELLGSLNTWLRNVAQGELKAIAYTSLSGELLKGWVILPIGYTPLRRYPTVTWVYAGEVQGERPDPGVSAIQSDLLFNLQLLASHGYAVLLPSMPLKPRGQADDPLLRLQNGVMPAVDELIRQGIADPDRLFVAGHSFGGFSTYGLITQTHRFKAAIASAGITDLVSYNGQPDARARYYTDPNEMFDLPTVKGQTGMGDRAPWQDIERYTRNSPIMYVDKVETPLLIMHGDMDFVPIQQAEEFFAALYWQHKPVSFVRYWGESHVVSSPANVRDLWNRVYTWLDFYGDIVRDDRGELIFDGDRVRRKSTTAAH